MLYFDPDMVLFSRVDDILATLETSNLALTPHQTKPEQTLDAIFDNEVASLKHGIFNLGFIGVRNTAEGQALRRLVVRANLPSLLGGCGERPLHRPEVGEFRAGLLRRRGDHQVVAPQRRHVEPDDAPDDRQLRDRFRGRRRAARLLPFHRIRQRRAPHHGDQERFRRVPAVQELISLVRGRDRDRGPRSHQRVAVGIRALLGRHAHRARPSQDLSRSPRPAAARSRSPTTPAPIGSSYLGWCKSEGKRATPSFSRTAARAARRSRPAWVRAFRCRWRFASSA